MALPSCKATWHMSAGGQRMPPQFLAQVMFKVGDQSLQADKVVPHHRARAVQAGQPQVLVGLKAQPTAGIQDVRQAMVHHWGLQRGLGMLRLVGQAWTPSSRQVVRGVSSAPVGIRNGVRCL